MSCHIQSCVVVLDKDTFDIQSPNDAVIEPEVEDLPPVRHVPRVDPELRQLAYEFGQYLSSLPNKTATASQACKHVYLHYPSAREILARHGKLRGLLKSCPYLQMNGAAQGCLYLLSFINQ